MALNLKHTFILWLLIYILPGKGQNKITLEQEFAIQADFIQIDNLGNMYAVTGDQVQKYNAQWKPVNTYSNKLAGKISSLDAANPLKIVVFYKNLSQVVFLDNTMSAQGDPVALEKSGLELATLVCSSVNNGIWIYDQRNFRLVRLDQNLKIIAESGNIAQQAGGELQPEFLVEKNNNVYLSDPERGIMMFDIFGTYIKTIPLKNIYNLQALDEYLYFLTEGKFRSFSTQTLEQNEIPIADSGIRQVHTDGKRIFVLLEGKLRIYRLN